MSISDDTQKKIRKAVRSGYVVKATKPLGALPTTLNHYTRPESFLKIVETRALRGTHIRFMNDTLEYTLATNLALEAVRTAFGRAGTPDAKAILQAFTRNLEAGLELARSNVVFVASLSSHRDDLSQWRAYGGREGGVSLGFEFSALWNACQKPDDDMWLLPVIYDPNEHRKVASSLVADGVKLYEALRQLSSPACNIDADEFAYAFMREATIIGSIVKDKAFHGEREWRLISLLELSDTAKIKLVKFVAKETLVVPTYNFDLTLGQPNGLMPLTDVLVGPGPMAEHSKVAIEALLMLSGYQNVAVSTSGIPFRVVS